MAEWEAIEAAGASNGQALACAPSATTIINSPIDYNEAERRLMFDDDTSTEQVQQLQ